jgi:hypothetical protein
VWIEVARHRVRDEKGVLQFIVEMTKEAHEHGSDASRQSFYFLLDGQDVRRASNDTFVNLVTGEVLVRADE